MLMSQYATPLHEKASEEQLRQAGRYGVKGDEVQLKRCEGRHRATACSEAVGAESSQH